MDENDGLPATTDSPTLPPSEPRAKCAPQSFASTANRST